MKKVALVLFLGFLMGWTFIGFADAHFPSEQQRSDADRVMQGSASDHWILTLDGTQYDELTSVAETNDGGFIVAGATSSFGAGGADFWVLKFNPDASIAWQKTYGGTADDRPIFIGQTEDGGFFVVGETSSFRTDDYWDVWILRIAADGSIIWQETCCPTDAKPTSAQITHNGELILGGYSTLSGSSFLIRIKADGTIAWQKTLSGIGSFNDIQETNGGEFLIAAGNVILLDANGNLIWHKYFQGVGLYSGVGLTSAQQTSDGGFIVSGLHYEEGGGLTLGVLRLTSSGAVIWQKDVDVISSFQEPVLKILESSDSGFLVLVHPSVLLKLDANGNFLWQKAYEGFVLSEMAKATDGGVLVVGSTNTSATVLKVDVAGDVSPCGFIVENTSPITNSQTISTTFPITIELASLTLADTTSIPMDTGVDPVFMCEAGRQMPKLIHAIFTASDRPNVILTALDDPSSNDSLLPQYTIDGGASWQDLVNHTYSPYISGITPRDDPQLPVRLLSVYPGLQSSLYRSGDWGNTWASAFIDSNNASFAISPKNSQYTYWSYTWTDPCYPCDPPLHTELHQSSDGGVNWIPIYSSIGYEIITLIAPSPVNEGDGFFKINYYFGGEWWYRFGNTNQLTFPVDLIALDATDANRIYGVTNNFLSGQTSPDGGLNWNPWASSPPPACVQLMAHPTKTNTLYLRCAAGLFRSTNGGDSWTQITTQQGDALAPHLGNPGQILWSRDGCLLASDNDGDTWNLVNCFNTYSEYLYLPILKR